MRGLGRYNSDAYGIMICESLESDGMWQRQGEHNANWSSDARGLEVKEVMADSEDWVVNAQLTLGVLSRRSRRASRLEASKGSNKTNVQAYISEWILQFVLPQA